MKVQQKGLFGPIDEKSSAVQWVQCEQADLIRVAFKDGGDNLFDYALPEELKDKVSVGQRVRAPLGRGNRSAVGFCVAVSPVTTLKKVKYIYEVVDPAPLLDEKMMQLAGWMAEYYCSPLGAVVSAMVPMAVKRGAGMVRKTCLELTEKGEAYSRHKTKDIRLSDKGKVIISFLAEHSQTSDGHLATHKSADQSQDKTDVFQLDELMAKFQYGRGPFQTLARHGLIRIFQRKEPVKSDISFPTIPAVATDFELNGDQTGALERIKELIDLKSFHAVLLYGVTGSGKTEVYIQCIEKVLRQGGQAIVLVPEIAMTPQTVGRFLKRFENIAILHSGLTSQQRHQQWRRITDGDADVVVGARSAVFAPLERLGLIVVDEEHEPSYKQDTMPRYHGRDVAIKRAQMNDICVVLGSATPSLESLHNCRRRKHYHLVKLPRRVMNLPLPKVTVVNMRTETFERRGRHLLSRRMESEIKRCLDRKKQAILLLNLRGHSHYIFCPSCEFVLTCPNCDVNLTFHKRKRDFDTDERKLLMCHYCLHQSMVPSLCPVCGKKLMLIGPGTQRAEEEIRRKFPDARLQRVDSDSMKPGDFTKMLADFAVGEIDIMVGTQMIGKGLDFPNVEMVGVLNADTALSLSDFRSSERSFQLIGQVAGRCGRAEDSGRVVVQSYMPDEPAIKYACRHDYDNFSRHELNIRGQCRMPPFERLARIVLRDVNLAKVQQAGRELREEINKVIQEQQLPVEVRGPVPAGIARMENYHRHEIIMKARTAEPIQKLLAQLRRKYMGTIKVRTAVDVDPINLL